LCDAPNPDVEVGAGPIEIYVCSRCYRTGFGILKILEHVLDR
jgi:hypothetical protein